MRAAPVVVLDASATSDGRRYAGVGRYVQELTTALGQLEGRVKIDIASPSRAPLSNRWPYRYARGQSALLPHLVRTRPDVVHGLAGDASVCFPIRRQVITVHDVVPWAEVSRTDLVNRPYLELQRRLLRRAGAIIVPAAPVVAEVAEELAIPRERITAIPHGIAAVFSAQERQDDSAARAGAGVGKLPYLLWVGSLHGPDPRKGLDLLFAAMRSTDAAARPSLVLVGKQGDGTRWAREQATREAIELLLPGFVDDSVLAAIYRGAAAVVVPSRHEGFGLPALEALACGAPLIVTDAGSLPAVVGQAALVIPADDADALGRGLEALLADEPLRARLRASGPVQAAGFSWHRAAVRTLAVYESIRPRRLGSVTLGGGNSHSS
jgi:glycosyltransferase involved in cell wall biosynthesis